MRKVVINRMMLVVGNWLEIAAAARLAAYSTLSGALPPNPASFAAPAKPIERQNRKTFKTLYPCKSFARPASFSSPNVIYLNNMFTFQIKSY